MVSKIFGNALIRQNLHAHVRDILTLTRMVGPLRWMEMAGSAEVEAAHQSKVAREIQSSNEEVSQHINTFWVMWYLVAS